jgi:acetoin utilization deacetylase AcuC-like enzyme
MSKYELLPEQLCYEGTTIESQFFAPEIAAIEHVLAVHDADYVQRLCELKLSKQEIRKIGFPLSAQLVERELRIAQGTISACNYALRDGIAFNIAGGTHHAFSGSGEGFCLLNDQAIAAQWLLDQELASQILIIDLDVHQGNGTAAIFADEPRVFTFSMHGKENYPLHKERSDLDIPLDNGTTDQIYLQLLAETLGPLLTRLKPDFLFFQAGVDVLATDKLGKLKLSRDGCKNRDRLVLETAKRLGLPVVVCMGGGYSEKLTDIIEAHANTYRLAREIY